jgi:hypothetical protein
MNALQSLLQSLPPRVRQTLYWLVTGVGAALFVLQYVGVDDLGPVTMTQALQAYALVSPLVGAVAVANVKKPAVESTGLGDLVQDHDLDMSGFEPVGDMDDVYGAPAT